MKYQKPSVIQIGSVADLTRGECGWGTENWTMDKTGFVEVDTTCSRTVCTQGGLNCQVEYYSCTVCMYGG